MNIRQYFMAILGCAFIFFSLFTEAQNLSVRIGNFDYGSMASISFIKDDTAAFVITPSINPGPGMAAPDNSIYKFTYKGIKYDWGKIGDAVVGRLTSDHTEKINFRLRSA